MLIMHCTYYTLVCTNMFFSGWCISVYHWCEVRTRMWIMGMERSGAVPKLNETMAIELGGNMIGEGIVFGIAATILVYEYNRSAAKEEAREADQQQRLLELDSRLDDLRFTVEEQDAKIRELRRLLAVPAGPGWTEPGRRPPS
ncbi:putative OPA3-like protein CG13603 isoform X2 [Pollicipes pollicipes]|uniref:putative OPA3-like protein CG13603 isoform X2 n=1 Tax=Pollicipes pollicipes TaxID=41117 RepID=UPI0018852EC6|nr:putative OPA3-like protein CG13603 isoform X2 [Pollicipes pollicipes]